MRYIPMIFCLLLLLPGFCPAGTDEPPRIDKIILMIPDGFSVEGMTLARWMNDGSLAWDPYICGLVRTYAADAPITDSAPASTAYATGHKSHTRFIGILPDRATMPGVPAVPPGRERAPLLTILEAARLQGRACGIVATSQVQHATPADFTAHIHNRGQMEIIAEQQVYNGLDVVLGGGADYLDPLRRSDKEDLRLELKRQGVTLVGTPAEMNAVRSGPLWGFFDGRALTCDKTRDPAREPSLAEMTDKAIAILDRNERGFFLMVEGSQIDWAAHGNDPVGYVADALAFNEAVRRALDFARADGRTVVIVVADHGTGGLTMGAQSTDESYDIRPLEDYLAPLRRAKSSAYELEKRIMKIDDARQVETLLRQDYALDDISASELQTVLDYWTRVRRNETDGGKLDTIIGPMLSQRAGIGWTTTGHVGGDVALAVYHPGGERPVGLVDNTEVNRYMQGLFDLDLDALTARYFIEAGAAFASLGAKATVKAGDGGDPVLMVRKGGKMLRIPAYKNRVWLNGKELIMPTVTVYSGNRFYVAQDVLKLLEP